MPYNIKVYGTETCHDTNDSRMHLGQKGLDYEFIDINADKEAEEFVIRTSQGKRKIPVIEIRSGSETLRLVEPSNAELDRALSESRIDAA